MTDQAINGYFSGAYPKALDFSQVDYEAKKDIFDRIAAQHGYRLAGYRLGRAVFTTKQGKTAA